MRILRVAQHLYPDTKGGGQYHVHAMSRDQAAMGHDVTVVTTRKDDSLPRFEKTHGYEVVRVSPGMSIMGNDVSPAMAHFLWRVDDEFDVIHAHSHLYFSTNLAALRRRLGDIPLAITNHGLFSQSAPERLFRWYLKTVGRWTFEQADVIFCYTETDRDRVRDLGVTSWIEVVPNGIDTQRFTPEGPTSELIDHDGSVVLFVGRLVEGKRPQDAIKAISHLSDLEVKLYVIWDGPMRDDLEAIAGESVEFLGTMSYHEMPRLYRSADALVLTSRSEGMPRTILEAISTGVPVISSHLDQLSSIVRDCGELVDIGDVCGYADAIRLLIDDKVDRDHVSRRTVVDEHGWYETVEQTTAVLQALRHNSDRG